MSISTKLKTVLATLALGSLVSPSLAQTRIRLGTLAPRGSMYQLRLQELGEEWRESSKVRLSVLSGGALGTEAEMVGMMRDGTLQAGLLSGVGLSDIEPGISGLQSIPMMFRSLDEVDHVVRVLGPIMEERLLEKGFVVLFWTDAAWVRLFTRKATLEPADLRKRKLFTWEGNPDQVRIWSRAGYRPVPLATGDIVAALKTGMIDATHAPPIFALASRFDGSAAHMLDLNWAPMIGAMVVRREAWEGLPAEHRAAMREAAAQTGRRIKAASREESRNAVAAMEKRGLTVHPVSAELEARWRAEAERFYPEIRGTIVPADVFDEVVRILSEYRYPEIDALAAQVPGAPDGDPEPEEEEEEAPEPAEPPSERDPAGPRLFAVDSEPATRHPQGRFTFTVTAER